MRLQAITLARSQIEGVLDALNHFLHDDEQLRLDMLEGETDLFAVVRRLLNDNEEDEGVILALKSQVEDRKARKDRAEHRIEKRKAAIASLMECAQLAKLPLPEATLSLRTLQPRPKVTDLDALPDEFVTIQQVRKPDLETIAAALEPGVTIPGVTMTNGGVSLSVRRR